MPSTVLVRVGQNRVILLCVILPGLARSVCVRMRRL